MNTKTPISPNSVPMKEARDRFPELARQAQAGRRVTVTFHGRPVVDVVPHDPVAFAVENQPPPRKLPKRVVLAGDMSLEAFLDDMKGER